MILRYFEVCDNIYDMKKTFILLMLLLMTGVSYAMDFKRVVQVVVTEPDMNIVEAVMIEVGDKTLYTNFDGKAYLDLPPGKYTVKLSKISYETEQYEIEISEKVAIIQLCIGQ
jgi:uncharacterized membrane protein